MQSKARTAGFKKVIDLCRKHGLIKSVLTDGQNAVLKYGPAGSILKKNILNEWLYSLINNNDVNLFPLETVEHSKENILPKESSKDLSNSLKCAVENYIEYLPSLGQNLPFGFATYGFNFKKCNSIIKTLDDNELILKDLKLWNPISVVFFCPPKKSMHWFYYWSKQRYLWWRKFSSIPSQFSMSEITNIHPNVQQLSLLLQLPSEKDHIESISLYESTFLEDMFHNYCTQNGNKLKSASVPSLVICESGLDLAILVYLLNSLAERQRDGQNKKILQLHYKLAPYKICILLEGEELEKVKKLKSVASHLSKELKDSGILLYPNFDSYSTLTESHFSKFDEIGLPFLIVMNENCLQTGVVGLRNRDTTLQEQVHVTELANKLRKYLRVKIVDYLTGEKN